MAKAFGTLCLLKRKSRYKLPAAGQSDLWLHRHAVVLENGLAISPILLLEAAVVLLCFYKFGTYPATHSWLAKFYWLTLLFSLSRLNGR